MSVDMDLSQAYTSGNFKGWEPDKPAIEAFVAAQPIPEFGAVMRSFGSERRDTLLYEPLLKLHPTWRRGAQGIGDCVSWGWELACTMLMAIQTIQKGDEWRGEAATEPIYGGSRVEARGGRLGGWGDGSYGAAAAKWIKEWGVLLRQDYSAQTGNPEHDLSTYSSKKAKNWGNYGCGGERDARGAGPLDGLAREHPVQTVSLVSSFEEAAAAIMNGYPVPVCSGQGFTSTRDADGFCRAAGSWAHCMLFAGVRFGARPGLLCFNSWGRSVSGPFWPELAPEAQAVTHCSWWVDAAVCDRMLRQRDSFAVSNFQGFPAQDLDWQRAFASFGRRRRLS